MLLVCVVVLVVSHLDVKLSFPALYVLFMCPDERVSESDVMDLSIEQRDVSVFLVIGQLLAQLCQSIWPFVVIHCTLDVSSITRGTRLTDT